MTPLNLTRGVSETVGAILTGALLSPRTLVGVVRVGVVLAGEAA